MGNLIITALTIALTYSVLIYFALLCFRKAKSSLSGEGNMTFRLVYSVFWSAVAGLMSMSILVNAISIPQQYNSLYDSLEEIEKKKKMKP
ncbi:hypothetical protein EA58_14555 [Photobacterium galatheae]|uniref:Uncharacterized protein n=1 Tax=Photobacterium galatheae TaxID=1654360 RepID=A0A066RUA4_9GAMM|nr:hypothetical protein EA58_14555 [Photobacterium galatheae]